MNPDPLSEEFLRLKQVEAVMGVSRSTVWRWITEHGLKVVRVGGVTRVRRSELERFLRRHESSVPDPLPANGQDEVPRTIRPTNGNGRG